jgi:hypothetical protein
MNNTLRILVLTLLLTCTLTSFSQIRSDYKDGMNIPVFINLKQLAPKYIKNITIEKPFQDGFYTIVAQLDNYREQTCFLRLMTFEVKQIMSQLWGKSTLSQKKALMKNILISYGCKPNKNGAFKFYGSRWHDASIEDIKDEHYIYSEYFDQYITKEDTKDPFFGKQFVEGEDFAYLLPDTLGISHIKLLNYFQDNYNEGILIQLKNREKNTYYYRTFSEYESKDMEYLLKGNYPRKDKSYFLCSQLIDYEIDSVDSESSKWDKYISYNINGEQLYNKVTRTVPTTKAPQKTNDYRAQRRSMLLEFLRSQILSEKEQEWYNKHYTKEQLDAMTRLGLGLGLGDGAYRCKSCGSTFSNQADLRAHENAYHDY